MMKKEIINKKNIKTEKNKKYGFISIFNLVLINLLRLILIFMFILAVKDKDGDQILLVFLSFLSTLYKEILRIITRIKISPIMETVSTIFIILSILIGTLFGVYGEIIWWDTFLHFTSGILLSFFALMVLAIMKNKNPKLKYSLTLIILFTMLFAITMGTVWEIMEFASDNIFGMNAQRAKGVDYGVLDTMVDTIANTIGAIITNLGIYFFFRKKKSEEIEELLQDCFVVNNK